MHCLLVTSESEARSAKHANPPLEGLVKQATSGKLGRRIWKAFRDYAQEKELLNGERRELVEDFKKNAILLASIGVEEAFDELKPQPV